MMHAPDAGLGVAEWGRATEGVRREGAATVGRALPLDGNRVTDR